MEFNIHTQAEGKYTFYVENENKELTLIGESDNLITKEGLEYVKNRRWCECFSTVRLGSADGGGSPVPSNSLTLNAEVAFATTPYANPGCGTYVTGSFDPAGTGITYVFFKSWRITNSTGADWVIKEVGACPLPPTAIKEVGDPTPGIETALFSHSYLPTTSQVTVSAGQAVITQYELRLTTKSVLSGKDMQFFTGGNSSWQIPNNQYGVTGCPFTFLKNSGTYLPVADVPAAGNGLFEPSTMDYYAGFIGKSSTTPLDTSADYVSDFYRARTEFQVLTASTILGPLYSTNDGPKGTQLNPAMTTSSKWKLNSLGNAPHKFAQEPETKYVYERSWRITTAPVPNHELNGLFVSTHATVGATMAPPVANATIAGNSWVMVFNDTWKRPVNTYLELSLKHTWAGTTPP